MVDIEKTGGASGPTGGAEHGSTPAYFAKFCALHSSYLVEASCDECNDLLCEACLGSGHDPSHSTRSVEEAAGLVREKLQKKFSSCASAEVSIGAYKSLYGARSDVTDDELIRAALEKVSRAIDTLHTDVEARSQQIEEHFNSIRKMVDAREQQLLKDVDDLRMAKLLPLEEQQKRLEQCGRQRETAASLLKTCSDPYNLIRMAASLEWAANNAAHAAKEDKEPCIKSKLTFVKAHQDELCDAISRAGLVFDTADIDLHCSRLHCPTHVMVGQNLAIEVLAVNASGQCLPVNDVTLKPLEVVVRSSADPSAKTRLVVSSNKDSKRLCATYKPTQIGTLRVTAKYSGHNMTKSPAKVTVERLTWLHE